MSDLAELRTKTAPASASGAAAQSTPDVTLVIPVYNEQGNILDLFAEIEAVVRLPYVALIIYDHEEDDTLVHREALTAANPAIRFVRNAYGRGVVNAFKTGFDLAETPYIVPIMCDLSDMPETVNRLYEKIHEGYDLVVASRYAPGGAKIGGPKLKKFLSRTGNLLLHHLTGIPTHDMTNAFIIYRKEVLDEIHIETTGGFEITMELIAKAYVLGYRIAEVPTINRDRAAGKSKFKLLLWIGKYLRWWFYILGYRCIQALSRPYRVNVRKGDVARLADK